MNGKDREERRSDSYQESRDVHVVDYNILPKNCLDGAKIRILLQNWWSPQIALA